MLKLIGQRREPSFKGDVSLDGAGVRRWLVGRSVLFLHPGRNSAMDGKTSQDFFRQGMRTFVIFQDIVPPSTQRSNKNELKEKRNK